MKTLRGITRELLGLRLQNFQGIIFICIKLYREIFKYTLMQMQMLPKKKSDRTYHFSDNTKFYGLWLILFIRKLYFWDIKR